MFGSMGIIKAALLGAMAQPSFGKVYGPRVYTSKNIGRNLVRDHNKYTPHQGERECARRRRALGLEK